MKVAIYTQVRENYGDSEKPYWKFKGGDVYIVPNLTPLQVLKVSNYGIPTLKALIESRNEGFEELVIDWAILDDDAVVGEPWDTPINLFWEQGRWVARRTVENNEYGWMNSKVASKFEEYEMLMEGQRGNYTAVYTMRNGDVVPSNKVSEYLTTAA